MMAASTSACTASGACNGAVLGPGCRCGTRVTGASLWMCVRPARQVAAGIRDGQFVRIKLCKVKSGKVKVLSLQTDALYWPTWQLQWEPATCTWQRTYLDSTVGEQAGAGGHEAVADGEQAVAGRDEAMAGRDEAMADGEQVVAGRDEAQQQDQAPALEA